MPPLRWAMQRPGSARVDDTTLPARPLRLHLGDVLGQGAAHMEESETRAALYAREVAPTEPDPEPSLYLQDKWS